MYFYTDSGLIDLHLFKLKINKPETISYIFNLCSGNPQVTFTRKQLFLLILTIY